MKINVESSPELATIETGPEGLQVRIWRGRSEVGAPVTALIARVGFGDEGGALAAIESQLIEAPTRVETVPSPPLDTVEAAANEAIDLLRRVSEALIVSDGLVPQMHDPFHATVKLVRDVFAGKPRPEPKPKPAPPPSWLVKDFWTLYMAAKATLHLDCVDDSIATRETLRQQIARLAPAFDVCEAERRHAEPSRLTEAEREALAGLHRWLHSPSGDCALIDAAQAFHEQVEAEDRAVCARLEAEENAARSDDMSDRSRELVEGVRRVFERTGLPHDIAKGGAVPPHGDCESNAVDAPDRLAYAITKRIIEDPRVSGKDADPNAAASFMAHAIRGAQMGLHARTAHPESEWSGIKAMAAPREEGQLVPWVFGFEVALETPAPADAPVVLTDELRYYCRRYLAYRAPEELSPREKKILEAWRAWRPCCGRCKGENLVEFGFDPPEPERGWRCVDCGEKWDGSEIVEGAGTAAGGDGEADAAPNDWKPDPDWRELPGNARDPKGEPS